MNKDANFLLQQQAMQMHGASRPNMIAAGSISAEHIPAGSLPIFKIWDNEWVPGAFCSSVGWCFIADREWGGGGNAVCKQEPVYDGTVRTIHTDEEGKPLSKGVLRPQNTVELKANGAVLTFAEYKALRFKVNPTPDEIECNGQNLPDRIEASIVTADHIITPSLSSLGSQLGTLTAGSIDLANGSSITFKELAKKREFTGTASVQQLTPVASQARFETVMVDGEPRDILVI